MKISRILKYKFSFVKVDDLVNIGGFSYSRKQWHPFNAVLNEFDNGKGLDHKTSILSKFYANYNLIENKGFLSVHENNWDSIKIAYIPPWGGGKRVNANNEFEHWIGPKSPEQIDTFLKYFEKLYHKIKKERYRPIKNADGFVRVLVLKKESKVKYLVVGGQKRSSILSHCGYKKIWVRLQYAHRDYPGNMPTVVNIKDLNYWPNVSNGLYTKENAMAFFNEYFEGNNIERM